MPLLRMQIVQYLVQAAGTEQLVAKYKENPNLVNGGIAVVAIAAASAFLFTEVEAVLQVLH